jgi:hypothetical protein
MGPRMQPLNEKFFTLFSKAGSNVVESAATLRAGQSSPNAGTTPNTLAATPLISTIRCPYWCEPAPRRNTDQETRNAHLSPAVGRPERRLWRTVTATPT